MTHALDRFAQAMRGWFQCYWMHHFDKLPRPIREFVHNAPFGFPTKMVLDTFHSYRLYYDEDMATEATLTALRHAITDHRARLAREMRDAA